ncbi:MAG: hypothetical protein CM15mP65_09560 [Crocinitomicaceae bacterium]|nr:MAG: hypothetical protein CM15mP65_09560 [Crocinitomicaceae bacterium]
MEFGLIICCILIKTLGFFRRARYQSSPLLYFGIGPDSQSERISLIDGNYSLFGRTFLRAVIPSLYVGLELDYQRLSSVKYKEVTTNHQQPSVGANGSTNLGLGLGILYDNIHNALNPRKGIYSEWAFLKYNGILVVILNLLLHY